MIIRKAYDDIPSAYWDWVKSHCERFIVTQHDADEDVKTTHCHVMIAGATHSDVTWQNARRENGIGGHTSILLQKVAKSDKKYDESFLGAYICKGDKDNVKLVQGYDDKVYEFIKDWVHHPSATKEEKEKIINRGKNYDEWDEIKRDFIGYFNEMNKPHMTLDGIRTWTMRWYWKRDGRLPPAQSYKRNASSLFVYYYELSNAPLDAAFEQLKELWY